MSYETFTIEIHSGIGIMLLIFPDVGTLNWSAGRDLLCLAQSLLYLAVCNFQFISLSVIYISIPALMKESLVCVERAVLAAS